jgi:hypothetical protein
VLGVRARASQMPIMDMSATEPQQAVEHADAMRASTGASWAGNTPFQRELWVSLHAERVSQIWWPVRKLLACCGLPRTSIRAVQAFHIASLSLALAGCSSLGPAKPTRVTAPSDTTTNQVHELAQPKKPPEQSLQRAKRQSERTAETKTPAALPRTVPGPSTPSPLKATEQTGALVKAAAPVAPTAPEVGAGPNGLENALVFKGPPRKAPARRAGLKWYVWLGLGLCGATLAVVVRLSASRKGKLPPVSRAGNDRPAKLAGLDLKIPLDPPQEVASAEKPSSDPT